ncbi:MAG: hypothetical protein H7Y86_01750 [Rhizobacter sp.]|nr:hypothetical protein [Ferruginibacter sp.]
MERNEMRRNEGRNERSGVKDTRTARTEAAGEARSVTNCGAEHPQGLFVMVILPGMQVFDYRYQQSFIAFSFVLQDECFFLAKTLQNGVMHYVPFVHLHPDIFGQTLQ